ncbi:polymer-forming cytoskeletal protein [Herbiconiux sp.]|uniref:polymer-forming cytoskeletal protein n=1 Tax=Herbiconiux sp. TaxID=1871186 RepID=UPI0025C415CF|nr:polymer-forming cytoskeletal protein [Herbiconiux sp.]
MRLARVPRWILGTSLAIGVVAVSLAAGASTAGAASPAGALSAAGSTEGPQFYTGAVVDVTGTVNGDVYAAGQSVTISGDITGDVIAAAQTITITGTVDGDVRLAAQNVTVSGEVTRSGTIFAADIAITPSGAFGDDVVGSAATATVSGDIGRDLLLSVDRLTISGAVGGDVSYTSDNEALIDEGAVTGTVERIEPPRTPEPSPWAVIGGWFLGLLYALVALSLITLLAGLLLPRWLHQVTDHLIPSPWKALLVGFIASMTVPVALLFLLVTVVGAPLALAGILIWSVLTLASFAYGAYYLGRVVLRGHGQPLVKSLVGGAILIVALHIPWLNILVWLAMVFFGLGAQLLEFHRQRPWSTKTREAIGAPVATRPPVATL